MSIGVYRVSSTHPWRGYQRAGSHLVVSLVGTPPSGAFASCKSAKLGAVIPVSDELATEVLGTRREPCPHIGASPDYSLFASGDYRCSALSTGGDWTDFGPSAFGVSVFEKCDVCGYFATYPNPWGDEDKAKAGTHPRTTFLTADRTYATLRNASWDNGHLVKSTDDSALTIWLKWRWHAEKNGALEAARLAFPDATILADMGHYIVLRSTKP